MNPFVILAKASIAPFLINVKKNVMIDTTIILAIGNVVFLLFATESLLLLSLLVIFFNTNIFFNDVNFPKNLGAIPRTDNFCNNRERDKVAIKNVLVSAIIAIIFTKSFDHGFIHSSKQ